MDDQQSVTQKIFKRLIRPLYNLFSQKLVHDLKVQEIRDLLLQINHRVFTLEEELQRLKNIQSSTNLILSGMDTFRNPLYKKYTEAPLEVLDLAEVIRGEAREETDIVSYFNKIEVDLKEKSVVIIGGNSNLWAHAAIRRGAKKATRIEASPKISKDNWKGGVHFVYPLDLSKMTHTHCDILIVPDANWITLLAPRGFAGLGSYIKEALILSARVNQDSAFTSNVDPAITEDSGRISLNDNYLRQQLHQNGFVEVHCLYTEGIKIDNIFDKKVTKFNHLKGYSIIKKNLKHIKDKKYNNETPVEKIYIGYKLPTKKYI